MKINILNEKMNVNPESDILVTKKRFFEIFYRMFLCQNNKTLSDNEIEYLSSLSSDTPTVISKNNIQPIIKKLNEKGLMNGKDLSAVCELYKQKFTTDVSIVMNFKIEADEG